MPIITERAIIKMQRLARRSKIQDNELVDYYQSFTGTKVPDIPYDELSNEEKAENMAYDVLEDLELKKVEYEDYDKLRDKIKKAIELDPNCLPAYEAGFKIFVPKVVRDRYILKGVEIGEHKFGGDYEKENEGHFWRITITRPYMRLLAAKAELLIEKNKKKEAIGLYERMMKLNPEDAVGVRYPLQVLYLEHKEFDKYIDLIDQFEDDYSPHNFYNYALFLYMIEGECIDADDALQEAIEFNPFVLAYLKSHKKLNYKTNLNTYNPTDESGAMVYCLDALHLWHRQFGIQRWLKKF